jgi:hypothetical protein
MNEKEVVAHAYPSGTYTAEELKVLADALLLYTPDGGNVVEIGCQYGSSTSALLVMAREHGWRVWCIDPFTFEAVGRQEDVGAKFFRAMLSLSAPFAVLAMTSKQAIDLGYIPEVIHGLHVDGDHSKDGVTLDCAYYLPRLARGGVAIFHDYGRCSEPFVKPVVDSFTDRWEVIHADTVRIVRKP